MSFKGLNKRVVKYKKSLLFQLNFKTLIGYLSENRIVELPDVTYTAFNKLPELLRLVHQIVKMGTNNIPKVPICA